MNTSDDSLNMRSKSNAMGADIGHFQKQIYPPSLRDTISVAVPSYICAASRGLACAIKHRKLR
jgi:hypothetical protein